MAVAFAPGNRVGLGSVHSANLHATAPGMRHPKKPGGHRRRLDGVDVDAPRFESPASVQRTARELLEAEGGVAAHHPGVGRTMRRLAQKDPDIVGGMLEKGEQGLGMLGMGAMLGVPAVGGVGKVVQKVGNKTKFTALEKAGGAVSGGMASLHHTTVSDVGHKAGIAKSAGVITQSIADIAAELAHGFGKITGLSGWMHKSYTAKAAKHFAAAEAHSQGFLDAIAKAPQDLAQHMTALHAAALGKDPHAFAAANRSFDEALKAAPDAVKKLVKDNASIAGFVEKTGMALGHHHDAARWSDVRAAIKRAPKAMAGASIHHTLFNGAFIGASFASMGLMLNELKNSFRTLSDMEMDISGRKKSTVGLLFGRVSRPVAEARSKLLKTFFLREATEGVGMVLNVKQAMNRHVGLAAFLVPQGISMGLGALIGESSDKAYARLSAAIDSGEDVPPEAYAGFLTEVSKDLGKKGASSAFTQEIARQYAAEKAAPAAIFKEIENGALKSRIDKLIAANEAAKAATPAAEPSRSHVDKLDKTARPAVGQYTGKLLHEKASEQIAPAVS